MDDDSARKLAAISLEPDHFSLSVRAMRKLLPLLEAGLPLATARKQAFPGALKPKDPLHLLPPVCEFDEIRNPAVIRSLTELRKVVNAIVRAHGKPAEIRVELARELKKPKWAREQATQRNRANEKARVNAAKRITAEIGIPHPSRTDIRKVLLADECGWHCPYTGRPISMRSLFSEPQFDIEHIIPFSRSLDDSFTNLTLCAIDENRNRKANQTPHEAYSGDPGRYEETLARVRKFTGERSTAAAKLRRFRMSPAEVEALLGDFSSRQLSDTAYSSRLASRYLGQFYGGVVDPNGVRRVQATSGQVTAYLRNEWSLNGILNDGATANGGAVRKTRDDHRHHAVDAVAIALTDAASIKMLSDAAQRAPAERRRKFAPVPAPWPQFVESVRQQIENIVVSHRVSKKVSGALHEETIYAAGSASANERRVRKPLASLTKAEVEAICDPGVKALVVAKLGGSDPKKAFANEADLPFFAISDGRKIPIKRVRVAKAVPTFAIGHARTVRHVASESNHHIEIFAELDHDGNEVEWDGCVVPLAEAYRRRRAGEPVVRRDFGANRQFKFSLCPGDTIEWTTNGIPQYFVVRGASESRVFLARSRDARLKDAMVKARDGSYTRPSVSALRGAIRKIAISPLGEAAEAHD
ncbi:MAG TPA: type II CRISPR RNA-guided endonuclease Cas9 [Candidatus Dormibacteraeota bacterium]|nr:type II CRISPR RNA-guided endonuclease Cas9 [Candidatus Dormibacteraeota bacterium]